MIDMGFPGLCQVNEGQCPHLLKFDVVDVSGQQNVGAFRSSCLPQQLAVFTLFAIQNPSQTNSQRIHFFAEYLIGKAGSGGIEAQIIAGDGGCEQAAILCIDIAPLGVYGAGVEHHLLS